MSLKYEMSPDMMSCKITDHIIVKIVDDYNKKVDEHCANVIASHILDNAEEYNVREIPKSKIKEIFALGLAEYAKRRLTE